MNATNENAINDEIDQIEKEIKLCNNFLIDNDFDGISIICKSMYQLHINQLEHQINILKIMKNIA